MKTKRLSAVRSDFGDTVVAILAPGCHEAWTEAAPVIGSWVGLASADGTGMSVEDDDGTVRVVLEEQTTYTVRVAGRRPRRAGFGEASLEAITSIGAHESVFRLDTGNLVGLTSLEFASDEPSNQPTPIAVRIRVRKLGDPDADFAWLVMSVVDAIRALALTVASPTGLKTARTQQGMSYSYEDFLFLRAIARDVERSVERIARNPHRRVVQRVEAMDSWVAPEVEPGQLASIASDPRSIAVVSEIEQHRLLSPGARSRFTRSNRHLALLRLPATRREVSFDTYENRFVRFAVSSFRRRALAISDAARRAGRPTLAQDASALALRFAALLRLGPFSEVGDLAAFVSTSQVLLREDDYNQLLRLYREFVLTADVVWDKFRTLQENRDVAGLYEIWVYLETVRAVATVLGQGADSDDSIGALIRTLPDGLHVNLAEGRRSSVRFRTSRGLVRVAYNESYGPAGVDPRPGAAGASYSLPLRPDVSISVEAGTGRVRIFLDAKYRVDGLSTAFLDGQAIEDASNEPEGTFKREDLYKMHTYRDAVGGAFAAIAVYPGSERRLYPKTRADFIARGGVGAIPLRPRTGYVRSEFVREIGALLEAGSASLHNQAGDEDDRAIQGHEDEDGVDTMSS